MGGVLSLEKGIAGELALNLGGNGILTHILLDRVEYLCIVVPSRAPSGSTTAS